MSQKCYCKHTSLQIPDDEWVCPNCGVRASYIGDDGTEEEGWVIGDSCNFDCGKLHYEDILQCGACGAEMTGGEYSDWYSKRSNMVKCPCCNGEGFVDKKTLRRTQ